MALNGYIPILNIATITVSHMPLGLRGIVVGYFPSPTSILSNVNRYACFEIYAKSMEVMVGGEVCM